MNYNYKEELLDLVLVKLDEWGKNSDLLADALQHSDDKEAASYSTGMATAYWTVKKLINENLAIQCKERDGQGDQSKET